MTFNETMKTFAEAMKAMSSKYQVIETTDLRTKTKSYKIYARGMAGKAPPVMVGIATREEAEIRARELEAAETKS